MSGESRFFIEHGVIHDRETGRHLTADHEDDYPQQLLSVLQFLEFRASTLSGVVAVMKMAAEKLQADNDRLLAWQAGVMAEVAPPNLYRLPGESQFVYANRMHNYYKQSALNLSAKLNEAQKPLLMANGTTTLYEYLKSGNPAAAYMDDWTVGYETCKQRLFNVVGPQLSATNVMPAPLTDAPAHDEVLLRQALAALEYHREQTRPTEQTESAIAAIRERFGPQPLPGSMHDAG